MKYFFHRFLPHIICKQPMAGIIASCFHYLWVYSHRIHHHRIKFLGYPIWQSPIDMQIYQELIFKVNPGFILQTGVAQGGSILYFSTLLDLINAPAEALVIGIDIKLQDLALTLHHPRIRLIEGDSTDPTVVSQTKALIQASNGFISLDSNHAQEHVLKELNIYSELVNIGSYIVAEDTHINGHPIYANLLNDPSPLEAVKKFLRNNHHFIADDKVWQPYLFSYHKYGWLRRID